MCIRDRAVDRVLMGPAKRSRKYSEFEKRIVAYHEAGHAVIGVKLDNAEIVQKVTIVPRGEYGGYNLMTPEEERFLRTKSGLLDTIVGLLAGRVAEELMFNEMCIRDRARTGLLNSAAAVPDLPVTRGRRSGMSPAWTKKNKN